MGHRCCTKQRVKRGLWSPEEDEKLINHITTHGHGSWTCVPKLAGLQRCGKSCRLRWINYLRPDLKKGSFSEQEEQIIIDVHRILGNRWAVIAKHLPGRTDNEVKNFWNSSIKKKLISQGIDPKTHNLISSNNRDNYSYCTNNKKVQSKSQQQQEPFSIITVNPHKRNTSHPPILTLPPVSPPPNSQPPIFNKTNYDQNSHDSSMNPSVLGNLLVDENCFLGGTTTTVLLEPPFEEVEQLQNQNKEINICDEAVEVDKMINIEVKDGDQNMYNNNATFDISTTSFDFDKFIESTLMSSTCNFNFNMEDLLWNF